MVSETSAVRSHLSPLRAIQPEASCCIGPTVPRGSASSRAGSVLTQLSEGQSQSLLRQQLLKVTHGLTYFLDIIAAGKICWP